VDGYHLPSTRSLWSPSVKKYVKRNPLITHTAGQDANGSLAVHTAVERQASVQLSGFAADL